MQPNYQETIQQKRAAAAQTNKEQSELAAMLTELKKMQMASLMGQSKPSVILTDQTDLGDKIKDLTSKLVEAVKSIDITKLTDDQLSKLMDIKDGVDNVNSRLIDNHNVIEKQNKLLLDAIKALKLSTVVNVPDPQVTIQERPIDFQPLIEALAKDDETDDGDTNIDLECYRAQDIKDDGNLQYVGFVNPDGHWYIIENDIAGNKMRYVFGSSNYAAAFKKAAQYEYKLLNEAIDAAA